MTEITRQQAELLMETVDNPIHTVPDNISMMWAMRVQDLCGYEPKHGWYLTAKGTQAIEDYEEHKQCPHCGKDLPAWNDTQTVTTTPTDSKEQEGSP